MRVFGLIGYPLSHSFSQRYFTEKFNAEKATDCIYENYSIPTIRDLPVLLASPGLNGLNVTIPYKEQVVSYLHWLHPVVRETGACNCIKITDGQLYGFNTDVTGFRESLRKDLLPRHRKALVLGTGGAAKAVAYVLDTLGIQYSYVSRAASQDGQLRYDEVSSEALQEHLLIINTTPLGMFPEVNAAPGISYASLTPEHYLFDLVYNPAKTEFLKRGEESGATIRNGHEMLIIQAEESWKIWNDDAVGH